MDSHAIHLATVVENYTQVQKEARRYTKKLRNSRKRKSQLEAEVRFLNKKLRSFKRKPSYDDHLDALAVKFENRSPAADDYRQGFQLEDAPQFYEVEVKFMDVKALGNGMMESAILQYSSSPGDR